MKILLNEQRIKARDACIQLSQLLQLKASSWICGFARRCYERRLVGAAGGNVSARLPGSDTILVTATGVSLGSVMRDDSVGASIDGQPESGRAQRHPSKETCLHLAIYRERPLVNPVYLVVEIDRHRHPFLGGMMPLYSRRLTSVRS
ncbi:MAG: class II aldolase/adducin family protein [Candidatus Atribacteria bacterium]|nr:class II aldolase/adducin family protein [Candidatus Atribacteria bacterium]